MIDLNGLVPDDRFEPVTDGVTETSTTRSPLITSSAAD